MKFTVPQDQFAAAAGWAAARISRTPVMPVLGGLLISASGGTLTVSAYDYQTSARTFLGAEIGEPGEALVSGRMLAEVAASLPADLLGVSVTTDGTRAVLTAGQAAYTLMLLPREEFPSLPVPGRSVAEFGADYFAQAVAHAAVAASRDDTLPALCCIRLHLDGHGTAQLAATDRYRLAAVALPYAKADSLPACGVTMLIPARDIAAVVKKQAGATVSLELILPADASSADPGTLTLLADRQVVTMRLTSADYPNLSRFTPDDSAVKATLTANVAALSAAVKRAAVVAERNTPVRLTPADGAVHIEAETGDEAGYADDIPVSLDGDPLPIAFNPAYLLDALASVTAAGAATARIRLTDSYRPALIDAADAPDSPVHAYQVLMPIKAAG